MQNELHEGHPKSVAVRENIHAERELTKQDRHVAYSVIEVLFDIKRISTTFVR